jgi:hypothetical protein
MQYQINCLCFLQFYANANMQNKSLKGKNVDLAISCSLFCLIACFLVLIGKYYLGWNSQDCSDSMALLLIKYHMITFLETMMLNQYCS